MLYRRFAIAVLVVAPVVVMGIEGFTPVQDAGKRVSYPDAPRSSAVAASGPVVAPVPPSMPMPPSAGGQTAGDAGRAEISDAGEPLPGAGQPMLAPGNGLPAVAPANGGNSVPGTQASAPFPGAQQ